MPNIINKIIQNNFNVLLVKSLGVSDIFIKVKQQLGAMHEGQQHHDIASVSDPSVEQIRDLKQFMQQSPSILPYKYVLLNEVEMLNKSAANALLQILEEPPLYLKVILFSYHQYVLPTILSRCKVLHLPKSSSLSTKEKNENLHMLNFEQIKQHTNIDIIKYFIEHAYVKITQGTKVAKYYKLYQEAIRLYKKNGLEKIAISKIILFNYLKSLC